MKYLYIILALILSSRLSAQGMPTGYCASQPTNASYSDIYNVTLSSINNTTTCSNLTGTQITGTGTADYYTDFTAASAPIPLLNPGTNYNLSVTIGDCGASYMYQGYGKVFIDWNRDGTFQQPAEEVNIGSTGNNGTNPLILTNIPITLPASFSEGLTRMRVSWRMYANSYADVTPCGAGGGSGGTNWGETEDYKIFLGARKYNYMVSKILSPDSIAICGETPQTFNIEVRNVGNQILTGGKIDCIIKGLEAGSTTSLFYSNTFTSTILDGGFDQFSIGPMSFPKDELLEFKFVITHPFDTFKDNDTFIKRIQVYKNPVFNLKSDTVCAGNRAKVSVINAPKPLFLKWDNEAITDTTSYITPQTQTRTVTVWRGWKCRADSSLTILAIPNPTLALSNDTVLCIGQKTDLKAIHNGDTAIWDPKPTTTVNTTGLSVAKDVPSSVATYGVLVSKIKFGRQCYVQDTVRITTANPPSRPHIDDTICAGEAASVGLNSSDPKFLYTWEGRTETTPIIHPSPTVSSSYYIHWTYEGCHDLEKVNVLVNPLPTIQINSTKPAICIYEMATLTASGAPNMQWTNGLGSNPALTVSPTQSTKYGVIGTDTKGCSNWKEYTLIVNPQPEVYVYSNKRKDNVCLGDSAIIYSNGAKSYLWNTGEKDSVIVLSPKQSFQWRVIGTDNNGCKDTVEYRMTVKPPFKYAIIDAAVGCEGDKAVVKVGGGIAYQWGSSPTLLTDSSAEIVLDNTTKYQVTITSPDTCDVVADIPVTVYPKPVIQVSDATVCFDSRATLEVKGGIDDKYTWSASSATANKISVLFSENTVVTVTGVNAGGCADSAFATVQVIQPQKVLFKSPKDTYECPSIPVTLVATPAGGVWSSSNPTTDEMLENNKFKIGIGTPEGEYILKYTLMDPIHGCQTDIEKTVTVLRPKCAASTSSVLSSTSRKGWSIYPNPFREEFNVEIESAKNEKATIQIYDQAGRAIYTNTEKLRTGMNTLHIQNENWAKGIYFIEVQTETSSRQQSIVKE